jgi:hypothetical protein
MNPENPTVMNFQLKIAVKLSLRRLLYKHYSLKYKLKKLESRSKMSLRDLNIWRRYKYIKPTLSRW